MAVTIERQPETTDEALSRLMGAFERYAGWLATDRTSVILRAHVQDLLGAVNGGTSAWPSLHLIGADLERIPPGDVRKMLRKTLAQISALLERESHSR